MWTRSTEGSTTTFALSYTPRGGPGGPSRLYPGRPQSPPPPFCFEIRLGPVEKKPLSRFSRQLFSSSKYGLFCKTCSAIRQSSLQDKAFATFGPRVKPDSQSVHKRVTFDGINRRSHFLSIPGVARKKNKVKSWKTIQSSKKCFKKVFPPGCYVLNVLTHKKNCLNFFFQFWGLLKISLEFSIEIQVNVVSQ